MPMQKQRSLYAEAAAESVDKVLYAANIGSLLWLSSASRRDLAFLAEHPESDKDCHGQEDVNARPGSVRFARQSLTTAESPSWLRLQACQKARGSLFGEDAMAAFA
jgi:hypothetical protein